MLKLKIGQNYLLIDHIRRDPSNYVAIAYMMGCFHGNNKVACYLTNQTNIRDLAKMINESHISSLYLLWNMDFKSNKNKLKQLTGRLYIEGMAMYHEQIIYNKNAIRDRIHELQELVPNLEIKVIAMNSMFQSGEYRAAVALMEVLKRDTTNILSVLDNLEIYKKMSQRHAAIPKELDVINNDIKRLDREIKVCDRIATVDSLKYLHLIKEAKLKNGYLYLTLYELPINLSEKMGEVFDPSAFKDNPYMFKAASYIYSGCHFKMPETEIKINTGFRPEFIQTLDHRFDNMFKAHNWSTIGYPHFGLNHLCGGEFNDTMAHGKEYGLEYYFISLKQYLTTANMRDYAGVKVWWYPIYDKDENMVYCAGLDNLMENYIKTANPELYVTLQNKTWEEKATALSGYGFNDNRIMRYGAGNYNYSYKGPDAFLQVCKEQNIDLYNKIMKGETI
jgi:hypothetical protein